MENTDFTIDYISDAFIISRLNANHVLGKCFLNCEMCVLYTIECASHIVTEKTLLFSEGNLVVFRGESCLQRVVPPPALWMMTCPLILLSIHRTHSVLFCVTEGTERRGQGVSRKSGWGFSPSFCCGGSCGFGWPALSEHKYNYRSNLGCFQQCLTSVWPTKDHSWSIVSREQTQATTIF